MIVFQNLQSAPVLGFWARLVLAVLAVWRISHLLAAEDGPWEVFARLRRWLGMSFLGRLMDCFGCISLWIAAPVSFFVVRRLPDLFFCWLALSGGAFLLERMHSEPEAQPVIIERLSENEKEDSSHGMLR
ncbi:hypothetical protein [Paracidobacterium acidisoli]|uniref:DUF1360 domain-containing protein n=1 Tax=Paracidobacterium acidisoli TaxID=2303751 RepID=A0A372ILP1_9BACT|nr:hypothetical protein [Paracidobacterium acidisoli]MBT9332460.1 hypothetical protein [Paracidobacterium acidisoli]